MMLSRNPHDPSDIVTAFEPSGSDGVKSAVERATETFPEWSRESATVRGQSLDRIANELERRSDEAVALIVREVGKPLNEARAELSRAVAIFRYYAQTILAADGATFPSSTQKSLLITQRFPVGVCALVTPWNFPVAIPSWKIAPAIGYGNTAVFKPAPAATATGRLLHEIIISHCPDGVLGIVVGDAESGAPLVEHPDVAAVSFTGSRGVGQRIAEAVSSRQARLQCEMGGQNASIVLADADIRAAAATIAYAAMGYAGQKCTATSRIIVERSAYGEFRSELVDAVGALGVKNPMNDNCVVGPLIDDEARASAFDALQATKGRIVTGASPVDGNGFYFSPSLVEVDDLNDVLAREEVFAPVAALIVVDDIDEAIKTANATEYGLVGAIFTGSLDAAMAVARQLEAGLIKINAPTSGVDFHVPFGGTKASSFGPREQGFAARDFYTESRTIQFNSPIP